MGKRCKRWSCIKTINKEKVKWEKDKLMKKMNKNKNKSKQIITLKIIIILN